MLYIISDSATLATPMSMLITSSQVIWDYFCKDITANIAVLNILFPFNNLSTPYIIQLFCLQ